MPPANSSSGQSQIQLTKNTPFAQASRSPGLQVTIYYPAIDPDGSGAPQLADMLEQAFMAADR